MSLINEIKNIVGKKNMLLHPFYQDWMAGRLSKKQLQNYAVQYLPFVDAFPQFVSATHSLCDSAEARRSLLENLNDEEGSGHSEPHPKLWRDFASGVGADIHAEHQYSEAALQLKNTFLELSRSSYEEGLCALYTYEQQIPEIAKAKILGLAEHYGISDNSTTQFFSVHEKADIYHSKACEALIEDIQNEKNEAAKNAVAKSSQALWDFLTSVHH